MADPVETYLSRLCEIRSSGLAVDETSYYGALETLLNEVGRELKPRVRCVLSLKNSGAGIPDGGLFTPEQFQKRAAEPVQGQLPSRGAVEAKGTGDELAAILKTDQAERYCQKYGQLLLTNYREFLLAVPDPAGKPIRMESYRLGETESAFWANASHPRKASAVHGRPLIEFLKRVMLHPAAISAPADVAWFLASYARDARARVEAADIPSVSVLRTAFEDALGIKFEGARGEHFFRSTLVQTLFYGIFSAWVLWSRHQPSASAPFDWRYAAHYLRVPVIRKLFHEIADPGQLELLHLTEVLDWAAAVLNRVERSAFFARFEEERAVQYFYEPFLEAYDPELRKQLGVWYTPEELVRYMVARVDAVLKSELGIEDGLADPRVFVLDPCCGTGAYLVEVLRRIDATLKDKGENGLRAHDLKDATMHRIFGFEILPAPFVVAHLQMGLHLHRLGAPLADSGKERAAIYLTNALTGWEPPKGAKRQLYFPELQEERDAADHVKRDAPILVILGNPPYNGFAGTAMAEDVT